MYRGLHQKDAILLVHEAKNQRGYGKMACSVAQYSGEDESLEQARQMAAHDSFASSGPFCPLPCRQGGPGRVSTKNGLDPPPSSPR